ncbi:uncharacterized protein N7484_002310 [Penicillium longicatenatum]|uniref:uncharacterized protein n=1 Tax=Penicillium longicatenatum TaxID=1561947 RepID=UPI00254717A7|nr:uncharacterized protein N7484_002310 [Penicillium longicatenatum]KAJ5658661.1 hypothetical protein N7484_002310 [Penicillium longicatenatum]
MRMMREVVLNASPTATKTRFVVRNHGVESDEDKSPATPAIIEFSKDRAVAQSFVNEKDESSTLPGAGMPGSQPDWPVCFPTYIQNDDMDMIGVFRE